MKMSRVWKLTISFLTALAMIVSVLSISAFAADDKKDEDDITL